MAEAYRSGEASYTVRGREIPVKTTHETMSGTKVHAWHFPLPRIGVRG